MEDAKKRIMKEFEELKKEPNLNIGVTVGIPNKNNIFEWRATILGPKDTSYRGGLFFLSIKFPQNYPNSAPEICFTNPIYHINVNHISPKSSLEDSLGKICISTLNWWKPEYYIIEVLTNIFALFYMANPDSPYGLDRADEFRYKWELHEEKIRYFTKKYANPRDDDIGLKQYESWDFSYP